MEIYSTRKKKRQRSFPVARYLRLDAAGINISDHSIKFVELALSKDHSHMELGRFDDIPIAEGVVSQGHIKQPKVLQDALNKLQKKYELEFVRVSIPEEQAYLFSLPLPNDLEGSLRDYIAFRITEHVPLSREEAVFDFDIVEPDRPGELYEANVSVLKREFIETFMSLFAKTSMIPLSFEIEAEAIKKAVVPRTYRDPLMIVDVGRTRTGISLVDKGVVRYTATVETGGDEFTKAIEKSAGVTYEEADKLKQEEGFSGFSGNPEITRALSESLNPLKSEIKKRVDYWISLEDRKKKSYKKLKKIILCGGHAPNPGLAQSLSYSFNLPVEIANVWSNVLDIEKYVPEISRNHSLQYSAAIGLALSDDN